MDFHTNCTCRLLTPFQLYLISHSSLFTETPILTDITVTIINPCYAYYVVIVCSLCLSFLFGCLLLSCSVLFILFVCV